MSGKIKFHEEVFMEHVAAGEFSVDPEGRIWRHVHLRSGVLVFPRRAENTASKGYLQVRFMHNGKRLAACAQRIVYRALKAVIPNGMTVNHEDGVKTNNHPSNLSLATDSEQIRHAINTLKVGHAVNQSGVLNSMAKLVPENIIMIRKRREAGEKLKDIAKDYGVTDRAISKIALGQRWKKPVQRDISPRVPVCSVS